MDTTLGQPIAPRRCIQLNATAGQGVVAGLDPPPPEGLGLKLGLVLSF